MIDHKNIDEETLNNLLYLSRLSSESADIDILKKQVKEIVGYFEILSKYDTISESYDIYPSAKTENIRKDEELSGLDINNIKKISEHFMDGYFQVPKVLGEGV